MIIDRPQPITNQYLKGASATYLASKYEISVSTFLRRLRKEAISLGKSKEVEETIRLNKLRISQEFAVATVDDTGKIINSYISEGEAAKHYAVRPCLVRDAANPKHPSKTAAGLTWIRL